MKLEQQVCNLELAKKLKELGVKQESYFTWVHWRDDSEDDGWDVYHFDNPSHTMGVDYSAFTVAELGELLPDNVISYR